MLSYNVLNSWVEKMMKKSLPVKIKTSDITNLSTKDINKLKAGDIVLKKTGNQKYAYIVSYKEENQGICLTYTDASVIETVSYDYNTTTKVWVYNSTDITQVQPKLTAGANIQINNGTISATDTTYTAGTGVTITDGVISATGVSVELYRHEIYLNMANLNNHWCGLRFEIYNNTNTKFTIDSLKTFLGSTSMAVTGFYSDSGNNKVGFCDELRLSTQTYGWFDVIYYYADNTNAQTFTSRDNITYNVIVDTVTRVL